MGGRGACMRVLCGGCCCSAQSVLLQQWLALAAAPSSWHLSCAVLGLQLALSHPLPMSSMGCISGEALLLERCGCT